MIKKVGIIGLGTITKYYLKGLEASALLSLCAVCDVMEEPVSKTYYDEYPFYQDYKAMIANEALDYVIISTPPASHFEIASYALSQGVNVIIEKPATVDLDDYNHLLNLAKEHGCIFEVMYHWQNGSEVLGFNELYDKDKISEVGACVLDPYSDDEITINKEKVKLCGAFIDSGVNILSMFKTWLAFDCVELVAADIQRCKKTDLPIYANVDLLIDGIKANVTVDWRKHLNLKESYVIYDGRKIELKHSAQAIVDGEKTIPYEEMERLQCHYYNYFKNYREQVDVESSYRIHKALLEVNAKLK